MDQPRDFGQTLEQAHTDTAPFIQFILGRIIETQREQLRLFGEDLSSASFHGGVKMRVGGVKAGAYGGVKSAQASVLEAIKAEGGINAPTLSNRLALGLRTTQRCLKELSEAGLVIFKGAPKNGGYWNVAE